MAGMLVAGLAAGGASLLLSLLLRLTLGTPFIPELGAQALFTLTPGEIESRLVLLLGAAAKYGAVAGGVVAGLFIHAALALLAHGGLRRLAPPPVGAAVLAYLAFASLGLLLSGVSEVSAAPASAPIILLGQVPPSLLFGLSLRYIARPPSPKPVAICTAAQPTKHPIYRRRLIIKAASTGAVASVLLIYGLSSLFERLGGEEAEPTSVAEGTGTPGDALGPLLRGVVTPNDLFYRVDINPIPPRVDTREWRLRVSGMVEKQLELTFEEICSMPHVEIYATLECVSNEIGGDLVSTALWRGVRLRDVLERAGVRPGAAYVVFRCSDSYDVGIPMERALLEGTILAYAMNREILPEDHGFPLRAVVPGLYGMMNAKWITEIEVVGEAHLGFWQRRGWSNEATYKTHSWIAIPSDGTLQGRFRERLPSMIRAGERSVIAGLAFAGDRGIERVEVSTDGGETWTEATLRDPLSGYTWVVWSAEWTPPGKGRYRLLVRATDKEGRTQTAELSEPFPSGATGYHVVDIHVG